MFPSDSLFTEPHKGSIPAPEGSTLAQPYKYVVISPVKDEAAYIEQTICSMIAQTIQPSAWVIVNDGSRDATESIIQKYSQENNWIRLVNRQDTGIRKRGKGVVEAFYTGYKTLTDVPYPTDALYPNANSTASSPEPYNSGVLSRFIVKLDGDVSFGPDYFETLLNRFHADPKLGIAGGGLYEKPDGKTWTLYTVKDHVRGCTKIYRRECFEEIGGLVASMGWDGIDEWKALAKGWKVESFLEPKIYHYRFTGAATGFLKSCIEQGNGAYRMGYHPLFMIARGIRRMTDRPFLIGGAAMIGAYFIAWYQKQELLAEPSVVSYIRQSQMKMLTGLISGKPIHEGWR
ncbi:MAG: glycosyltransferase family 2 protein [Geobacteraceae bacterium]|nr:MAG: glycosyltransferase family 2 protein [Geobacteraceae bacterium]